MPMAARQADIAMYQKGSVRPIFVTKMAGHRPLSEATEIDDTDFEEDFSDTEEYSGRRSEESVSRLCSSYLTRFAERVSSLANKAIHHCLLLMSYVHQIRMNSRGSIFNCRTNLHRRNRSRVLLDLIYSGFLKMPRRTSTSIFQCPRLHRLKIIGLAPPQGPTSITDKK